MATSIANQINQLQNNTNQLNFQRGQQNLGKNELDKNAFLQLLMAQLQNQDPLNPVDNKDFLAQQAQLSQVEKLDNLTNAITASTQLSQISQLVGKHVEVKTPYGQSINGIVSSGEITNGQGNIEINGENYSLAQVTRVYANAP